MLRNTVVAIAVLVLIAPVQATAGSLAGSEGHKRFPVSLPKDPKNQCRAGYDAYVAASGHSAYASTVRAWPAQGHFCGIARNMRSKELAEQEAIKYCQSLFKRYKMTTAGHCEIYASK